MNRIVFALVLAGCSSSELGTQTTQQQQPQGFRTTQTGVDLAAGDYHGLSIVVPAGATLLDIAITGSSGSIVPELWRPASNDPVPCTGAGADWTCVVTHPNGGDWALDLLAETAVPDLGVSWWIEGAGQEDLALIQRPVPAGWSTDLEIPAALGHLQARLDGGTVGITRDGVSACEPGPTCTVAFATQGDYTITADSAGQLAVDWIAADLLLDRAVSFADGDLQTLAFEVPEGTETMAVQVPGATSVRLMRGAFELCAGEERCVIDQPIAGSWSAVVELGFFDSIVQVGSMGSSTQPVPPAPTEPTEPTEPVPPAPVAFGDVRINEVLYAPRFMSSPCGLPGDTIDDEFVELVNATDLPVDLHGMTLSDAITVRHVFVGHTILQPGRAAVVYSGGDPSCIDELEGVTALTASTGTLALSDLGDEVVLTAPDGAVVDQVQWDTSLTQAESLTRSPDIQGLDLVLHSTVAAVLSSPGTRADGTSFEVGAPAPIPVPPLPDPAPDPQTGLLDLTGFVVRQSWTTAQYAIGSVQLAPGDVLVLARDADQATFEAHHGPLPANAVYVNTQGFPLLNGDETFELFDLNLAPVDGPTPPIASGDTLVRTDLTTWSPATVATPGSSTLTSVPGLHLTEVSDADPFSLEYIELTYGGGDPTPAPMGSAQVIINEVLVDPPVGFPGDANCDGTRSASDDEFVELVNIGDGPADLGGWILEDADATRHVFAPGTVLPAGEGMVVFGDGVPSCAWPAGVQTIVASTGALSLDNMGDLLALTSATGSAMDIVAWDSTNAGLDVSIVRSPELTATLDPLVPHHDLAASAFSPGTRADGSAL